jgi:hypothetical protein
MGTLTNREEGGKQTKLQEKKSFENEPSNMKSTTNTTRSHIQAIFIPFFV